MTEPAHRILINQYLDWDLVRERLDRYKHIATLYRLIDLTIVPIKSHSTATTWLGDLELGKMNNGLNSLTTP